MSRIGTGYDVHRLTMGRKLIIGGVDIPYERGLLGHSDADVLVHAIMDALLGAAALGDIGLHFPDNDPLYEGADSLTLLRKVGGILTNHGYYINNVDSTVVAQAPKLRPYIEEMRENIARQLKNTGRPREALKRPPRSALAFLRAAAKGLPRRRYAP